MRTTYFQTACLVFLLTSQFASVALTQGPPSGDAPAITKLELAKSVERELKGGETHSYSFSMQAGQFASLVVDQRGIDVVLRLTAPDGTKLTEIDSPNGNSGPEQLSFVARSQGEYRVDITSLEAKAPGGRYEAKLEAVRLATVQDKTSDLAVFMIDTKSDADRGARLVTEKDLVTAELSRELVKIGAAHLRAKDMDRAISAFNHARTIAESVQANGDAAVALQYLGNVYMTQRKPEPALESFKASLQCAEQSNDKLKIADSLERLGLTYRRLGKYDLALEAYRKGLSTSEAAANRRLSGQILTGIGHVFVDRGDYVAATAEYNKALVIAEEMGNKFGVAQLNNAIGIAHNRQGLYAQSLEYYNKALPVFQELKDKFNIASVLSNISVTYSNQGNQEGELEMDLKVLSLFEEVGDQDAIGRALNNVASTYRKRQDYAKALEYYEKSLTIRKSLNDKRGEAVLLNGIGLTLFEQKEYEKALDHLQRSIKLRDEFEDNERLAETLSNVARVYDAIGDNQRALEFATRSAALSAKYNYREMNWFSLAHMGRAYAKLNRFADAQKALEESIRIVDSIRIDVAGQHSKAHYFSGVQLPFDLYIDLLMQMHKKEPGRRFDEQAMLFSERIRARSLLESISEAGTDIRRGVSEDLLTRERSLYEKLNDLAFRQARLPADAVKERSDISLEISSVANDHQSALEQIRRNSPAYATLTQREPIDIKTIRDEVLDDETVMLQYFIGEHRGYVWTLTKDSLDSFELPAHAVIDPMVKVVYGSLSQDSRNRNKAQENDFAAALAGLSKLLLGPAAERLKKKRILVISDGPLQYLPFSVLHDPTAPKGSSVPVAVRSEVVSLPSVSTQIFLRRTHPAWKSTEKSVAVFADPVFDSSDERVSGQRATGGKGSVAPAAAIDNSGVKRSAAGVGAAREGIVHRLPFTRREADEIISIASKTDSLMAVGFQANRERVMSDELAKYRIVHFATHGILHSGHPELSGIVLSLVNPAGEPVNGFLRLNDIYNMKLNADLVVLSACQTALGKEVRGEGLIGLTRGFMYAGSPRVVASLWKVDDVATAELMKIFYQKMLKEKMRPAAALREAKIAMMKQKRWSSPYYWAAFELQGEWR